MKHILMVCYGGGHMKIIAPLYAELSQFFRVTVLALTSAAAFMRSQGIPSVGFSDFRFTGSSEIQTYGHRLANAIPENSQVSREETIAYLGSSFFDLVNQLGDYSAAEKLYCEKGRGAFLPVDSLSKIIDKLKVDTIVTTNSPRAELAAIIAGKAAGLPTVCINDNLWIKDGLVTFAKFGLADKICVLTEGVRERLVHETDICPSRIVVTGVPIFDTIKSNKYESEPGDKPRVLLADQSLPEFHPVFDIKSEHPELDEEIRKELNILASEGIIEVWFRPHPHQNYNYKNFGSCNLSPSNEDLHSRLAKVDVVVTAISTVGIEAKAMGLGLVSAEETVYSTLESYEKLGLSTGVRRPDELKSAILSEYRKATHLSTSELYAGNATQNISSVIKDLLRQGGSE